MIIPSIVLRSSFSGFFASVWNWVICPSVTAVWTSGSQLRQPPGHRYLRSADIAQRGDRDSRSCLSRKHHCRQATTNPIAAPELRSLSMSCCQREIGLLEESSSPPGASGAVDPLLGAALLAPRSARRSTDSLPHEAASDSRSCTESRRAPSSPTEGTMATSVDRASRLQGQCLQRRLIESVATISVSTVPSASLIACRASWLYAPRSLSPFAKGLVRASARPKLTAFSSPFPMWQF
jgi:hypothetical protein